MTTTTVTESGSPAFFAQAPVIRMEDPLAEFLGAAADGVLEYRYLDAVQLAGHSCPTVASAFLMTRAALRALYGDALPRRGEVRVELRDPIAEGVAGVIGSVAGLVTGAAGDGGFHGIGGQFRRRGLLAFGLPMAAQIRFTRQDTGEAVGVSARLQHVPGDPRIADWMPRCLHGLATPEEKESFRFAWQDRVRRLLVQHADDPAVIVVEPASAAAEGGTQ